MFLNHQISILECFLKDCVALKIGVTLKTDCRNLCNHRNKLHLKINEKRRVTVIYFYCSLDQVACSPDDLSET